MEPYLTEDVRETEPLATWPLSLGFGMDLGFRV